MRRKRYSHTTVFTFLAALVLAIPGTGRTADTPYLYYAEEYGARSGTLSSINLADPDESGAIPKSTPYATLLGHFQNALETQGAHLAVTKDKANADYHLVFVDFPFSYVENAFRRQVDPPSGHRGLPPPLPINKHAATASAVRELTSPWIRATLYLNDSGQIVGGTILVPLAEYVRIKELYHMARGEWDALTADPLDTKDRVSVPFQVNTDTMERYRNIVNATQRMQVPKECAGQPKLGKIAEACLEAAFGQDEQTMLVARVASMSGSYDGEILVRQTLDECFHLSGPFYTVLYRTLFASMLAPEATSRITTNTHYTFLPTSETLKDIAARAGRYNCFTYHVRNR